MKKIFFLLIAFSSFISTSFAASNGYLCIDYENLRKWNVAFDSIPKAINCGTSFILSFAWTIAMVMIIVWALKLSLWSWIAWSADKTKAKNTITFGILGFVVALSAWFIINLIIWNL